MGSQSPGGEDVRRDVAATCAQVAVGVDVAGAVALGLMFALEVPTGGPYRFGTTNDVLGAVHNALLVPVVTAIADELPPGPVREVYTPVVLGSCAVGAASSALLVARALPFTPSTVLSVLAGAVQSTWLLATSRQLRSQAESRALGEVGRAIGVGTIAGGAVAGVGALLPHGNPARRALLVTGMVPGAAAWLAWPAWLHLAARYLRVDRG